MTTETTKRTTITTVSGPTIRMRDRWVTKYSGSIERDEFGRYLATVRCACGRNLVRGWEAYDTAHSYMYACIERARACDPFDSDTEH